MIDHNDSSDVKIARLEEKLDYLTQAIDKLSDKFDDVTHTFVPRSEFDQLTIIVKGVANDGGLLKRVEILENTSERRKGSWSTAEVIFSIITTLLTILAAFLALRK